MLESTGTVPLTSKIIRLTPRTITFKLRTAVLLEYEGAPQLAAEPSGLSPSLGNWRGPGPGLGLPGNSPLGPGRTSTSDHSTSAWSFEVQLGNFKLKLRQ